MTEEGRPRSESLARAAVAVGLALILGLFLYSLLDYIGRQYSGLTFHITSDT